MGERSLTHVLNEGGKTLVTIYRQFDGCPTGMGASIKEALGEREIVNGIPAGSDKSKIVNGMEEAAALLVMALKAENLSGNIYLYPPDSSDCWEEYTYTIRPNSGNQIWLKVEGSSVLYDGPLSDFDPEQTEKGEYDEA